MMKIHNQSKEQRQFIELADEQKEPCLRALQKKVRNLTKKLNQISDLETRENLKPQQIDKLQKKPLVEQEKTRYEQFIPIYQNIVKENEKSIRSIQLTELRDIAIILSVRQYSNELAFQGYSDVEQLVSVLSGPSSKTLTLTERVQEITEAMYKIANNGKVKEEYLQYYRENPESKIKMTKKIEQKKIQKAVKVVESSSSEQMPVKKDNFKEKKSEKPNLENAAKKINFKQKKYEDPFEIQQQEEQQQVTKSKPRFSEKKEKEFKKKKQEPSHQINYQVVEVQQVRKKVEEQDDGKRHYYRKRREERKRMGPQYREAIRQQREKNKEGGDDQKMEKGRHEKMQQKSDRDNKERKNESSSEEDDGFIFVGKKTTARDRRSKKNED